MEVLGSFLTSRAGPTVGKNVSLGQALPAHKSAAGTTYIHR